MTIPFPYTDRFFAHKDPACLNIEGKPDRVLDIWYRPSLNVAARHFGHTWDIRGWAPEDEGKWTFNRSDVCAENEWWPAIYMHDTLADLLNHLEETFVEGVPANQPQMPIGNDYDKAYSYANEALANPNDMLLGELNAKLDEKDRGTLRDRITDAYVAGLLANQPKATP